MPQRGGLYSGLVYDIYLANNTTQIDNVLQEYVNKRREDSIVGITMMPTIFASDGTDARKSIYGNSGIVATRPNTIGSYTPKNKKLLTAPYIFLCVDTLNATKEYRWEWCADKTNLHFEWACATNVAPEVLISPYGYNGTAYNIPNYTESVVCSDFPQCAFTIDSYRAWVANKAVGAGIELLQSGVQASEKISKAQESPTSTQDSIIEVINFALSSAKTTWMNWKEATKGSKVRGGQGSATEVGIKAKNIYLKTMGVAEYQAKIIDDFFSRYGYSTNQIKIPNRNVRTYWTYTKTRNVTLVGSVPVTHMNKIKSIYDKGITFWNNPTLVGRYDLDNTVQGG